MERILVTGGIGSGKSEACKYLALKGIPVYDSDSRTKSLYRTLPGFPERIDAALGGGMTAPDGFLDLKALASAVFSDPSKLRLLESIVHPEVLRDFQEWASVQDSDIVAMESAIASSLPLFEGVFDHVIEISAPEEMRISRVESRDGSSREAVEQRMARQDSGTERAGIVIVNDGSLKELRNKLDMALEKILSLHNQKLGIMKTDLSKILSVSGHHGLYRYIAQARSGAIAESLADGKRTVFDVRSRITTLADIAIYTSEGEMKLSKVFEALHEALGDDAAPGSKASAEDIKALFIKAVPDYDEDRFYVSHMKKVVDWYNELKQYASLEFVEEEEMGPEDETSEDPSNA